MGNCVKLKWNRKRLGMTRKAFADHVGLSEETIRRLETDETVWATMRAETADKIYAAPLASTLGPKLATVVPMSANTPRSGSSRLRSSITDFLP